MGLHYILIYHKNGRSIFSECISGFCTKLVGKPEKLDELVMKLTSVPRLLANKDTRTTKYSMGDIDLHFFSKGDLIIVLGTSDEFIENEDRADEISEMVNSLNQDVLNTEDNTNLGKKIRAGLVHWSHLLADELCPAGDECPLGFGENLSVRDEILERYKDT